MLVLAGWQWGIDFLKQPIPHRTAMNPLTAVSFILTALSFLFLSRSGISPFPAVLSQNVRNRMGHILAVAVLAAGVLKLVAAGHIIHFSIDQVLFAEKFSSAAGGIWANEMTLNSACCFMLAGLSLLFLNRESGRGRMPAHYMALAIGMLGLLSLIGYLYRVQAFYGLFRYIPMAIHSAICFLLIALFLLLANPGKGILREFTSNYIGGLTARKLLPLVFLLPIGLGCLRLWGYWKGWLSTEFGVTILVLSIVFIFVVLIWYNACLLNKRDALEQESENILRNSEERYRLLVSSVKDYAIFMVDASGHIMSWNEGAERIKGYTAAEVIGRHIAIFYTKEEIDEEEPAHNLAMAREKGRFEKEGWRVRKDGSFFWANIVFTALYDVNGSLLGYTKVTRDITERKRTADQIAYLAKLIEDTSDAVFSTDSSFMIRSWNRAAELLFGYSFSEVKGISAIDVLRSPLNPGLRRSIREEAINEGYWKGEVQYLKKDDSLLTILLSMSGVRGNEGELDGFVMACRDITERKKLELQLQRFNKKLEEQVKEKTAELTGIFERITDAFIAVDKDFRYTYLNKKAGELIHHDPASLIGRKVWDVFPDAVDSDTYHAFNKAMAEQKNMTNTDYYPPLDLWQENYLYPSPDGLSVFIRDITEKKKREKEITDYKYALDQSSIVAITDQRGIIKYVNENFCRISGFPAQELLGQDHRIINSGYHPAAFIKDLWVTIANGKVWKGEICNKAKDGTIYWVDTTIVPFLNAHRKPYEYLAIRTDITERKKNESELQQSYQDIRQLASHLQDIREEERAGIAREIHDELGQQLTGLKMDLSWVRKKMAPGEDDQIGQKIKGTLELLDITIKTVRRIATELRPSILDDLGLIAAIEWQSLEFQKRSGIPTEFVSTLTEFKGSSAVGIGLFRICQESLTNIARHAAARHIRLVLEGKENDTILLKIEDDGKGFSPEKIGNKKTLGLLGMKERALMMGGHLEIISRPGKGTVLLVTVAVTHEST
jgi:PAS domain S-box-containing protein